LLYCENNYSKKKKNETGTLLYLCVKNLTMSQRTTEDSEKRELKEYIESQNDKNEYDPNQDKEQRRELRKNYRQLLDTTNGKNLFSKCKKESIKQLILVHFSKKEGIDI
jgi:hypothetical protein